MLLDKGGARIREMDEIAEENEEPGHPGYQRLAADAVREQHGGKRHEEQSRQCQGLLGKGLDAELDPLDAGTRGNNVEFH